MIPATKLNFLTVSFPITMYVWPGWGGAGNTIRTICALSCSRAVSGRPPRGLDVKRCRSVSVSHCCKSSISPWNPLACSDRWLLSLCHRYYHSPARSTRPSLLSHLFVSLECQVPGPVAHYLSTRGKLGHKGIRLRAKALPPYQLCSLSQLFLLLSLKHQH